MLLQCSKIEKTFIADPVLSDCSFHIEEREKAAIVGINGAGKSTLLKIIAKELSATSGEVTLSKGKTLGYLAQQEAVSTENTIYEELLTAKCELLSLEQELRSLESLMKSTSGDELSALMNRYSICSHEFEQKNGYSIRSEVTGILKGLGFAEEDFQKSISTLSGGQKTRVALGRLLLSKPDLILLDEPTNHLDMDSIAWLENYLKSYDGAVLIVAHDRYFLDKIVTKIIELERSHCKVYKGNYSAYAEKKQLLREAEMKQYLNQQQEIRHQEEVIRKLKSYNREKSIKRAESREKMLAKIDVLDKPTDLNDAMNFQIIPSVESGNDVLTVKGLKKSFGNLLLFENLNFEIKRGERIALIGKNGTGKTTILKMINRLIPKDAGEIIRGVKVEIGYYDQDHQVLHGEKTLFEEISDDFPDLTNTKIRNTLAAFLFTGDDVFKRIGDLSGGERGRMSLAKLMLSNANFLILDEPTNHLDMVSKEILEQALTSYTGTVFFVSHDRYFINKTATRILDLSDGSLTNYIGNYDYYLEKRENMASSYASSDHAAPLSQKNPPSSIKQSWQEAKAEQAKFRKMENDLKKIEAEIEQLETKNAEIDIHLSDPSVATNAAECIRLSQEKAEAEASLNSLMEEWETLQEAIATGAPHI